jgi:hypothetical protein
VSMGARSSPRSVRFAMRLLRCTWWFEVLVDVLGEGSFEAAEGFSFGESVGLASGDVVAGFGVVA